MNGRKMLEGIRILDLSRVMSGPFCTSMLADLGAEVIKIEMPGSGDEGRSFGPYKNGESAYFMLLNCNKKSVTINMKAKEGVALVKDMIPHCDVLVENFRPGVMKRLGLDYDTVRPLNDGLVYASISGFGQEGPLRDLPAFDLVIQAMSGLMSVTGPKGGPATAVGESAADVCTGMFAAFGIMTALFDRARGGPGRHIDISMLDLMMSMQLTGLSRQLYLNDTPSPVGNRHPVTYPVDLFPTRSGDIVMVCFSQGSFRALCELMGQPALADDPRFKNNDARNRHETELRDLISRWTSQLDAADTVARLNKANIPAAPVWNLKQLTQSDHVKARELVVRGSHSRVGDVPLVPQPVRFSDAQPITNPTTPSLGEHTEQVLAELLDLDAKRLIELKAAKAI